MLPTIKLAAADAAVVLVAAAEVVPETPVASAVPVPLRVLVPEVVTVVVELAEAAAAPVSVEDEAEVVEFAPLVELLFVGAMVVIAVSEPPETELTWTVTVAVPALLELEMERPVMLK